MKPELTKENFRDSPIAYSVINVLFYFDMGEGFELKHFRFALQDQYAKPQQIISDPQVKKNVEDCKKIFYENRASSNAYTLIDYYMEGIIIKNCLKSASQLVYYLSLLEKIGIIKSIKKFGKTTRYELDNDYRKIEERFHEVNALKGYSIDQRIRMDYDIPDVNQCDIHHITLYGMNKPLFDDVTWKTIQKEFVKLDKILKNIFGFKHIEWNRRLVSLNNKILKRKHSKRLDILFTKYYPFPFNPIIIDIITWTLEKTGKLQSEQEFYRLFGLIISDNEVVDIDIRTPLENFGFYENELSIDNIDKIHLEKDRELKGKNIDDFLKNKNNKDIYLIHEKIFYSIFNIFDYYNRKQMKEEFRLNTADMKTIVDFLWEYYKIKEQFTPEEITIYATNDYEVIPRMKKDTWR